MTATIHATHVATSVPSGRPSVILPSGQCSADWVWRVLDKPMFGDLAIQWDEQTREVHPVLINGCGDIIDRGLN